MKEQTRTGIRINNLIETKEGGRIMNDSGAKYVTFKVNAMSGVIESVIPDDKQKEIEPRADALKNIQEGETGFRFVTTILHSHSSPGCVYYFYRGRWYMVCY